jgi:hypothetical protein
MKGVEQSNPYVVLEQGMFRPLPQLHAVVVRASEDVVGLNVKHRESGDWLAVLRRFGPDGQPQVAFGSGVDFIGALMSLEGSLAADRWREDKPWQKGD